MASDAQIRANRANAKKSTGPKTAEGKAASCRNSFKHGYYNRATITFEEFGEEYVILRERLTEEYLPGSQIEHEMVDQVASAIVELHRYRRAEIGFWDAAFHKGRETEFVHRYYDAEVNATMNEALTEPQDLKRFNAIKRAQGTAKRKMETALKWLHRWGKTPQPSESKPRMYPPSPDEAFISPPGHHSPWMNDVYPIKRNTEWGTLERNGKIEFVEPFEIPELPTPAHAEQPDEQPEPAAETDNTVENTTQNETNPISNPETCPRPASGEPSALVDHSEPQDKVLRS